MSLRTFITSLKPSRSDLRLSLLGAIGCFILLHARHAFAAQTGPDAVTTAGMSSATWSWLLVLSGFLAYLAQWVDPANSQTPGNWSGKTRVIGFTVLGLVMGVLHAVTKDPSVPWTGSLVTAVMTGLLPGLLHFAPGMFAKAKAGGAAAGGGAALLVLVLSVSVTPAGVHVRAPRMPGLAACSLFPNVKTGTPLEDAIAVEQVAAFTDGIAVDAWSVAQGFIPPSALAAATAAYTKAQQGYVAAMQELQDGIAAGQDGSAQNWSGAIAAIKDAIATVVTVLEQFGAIPTPGKASLMTPAFAGRIDAIHKAQATLGRYH